MNTVVRFVRLWYLPMIRRWITGSSMQMSDFTFKLSLFAQYGAEPRGRIKIMCSVAPGTRYCSRYVSAKVNYLKKFERKKLLFTWRRFDGLNSTPPAFNNGVPTVGSRLGLLPATFSGLPTGVTIRAATARIWTVCCNSWRALWLRDGRGPAAASNRWAMCRYLRGVIP